LVDTLDLLDIGVGLVGGLALFLYGMHTMSEGLKAAAGEGMKTLLAKLTTNRFTAAITGAVVTAVIQSSSVTTVLVVGFISAGLMSLSQSVGVIMGANVGTTVTAQIVAFKVTKYAWAMVAAGFGFWTFPRRDVVRQYGAIIMGLGLLFLGMDQMSSATNPLRTYEPFIELMARMDDPLLAILLGAAFTALFQSSSATTGIVIMLASQGFLSLEGGIALAIGANIGTCFTAILSAFGKPPEAVRAAVVHVLFNVIGALIWIGFLGQLADVSRQISPLRADLSGIERLAAETPRQIANANTLFNVANTLILIWFTGPIAGLAVKLVPARERKAPAEVEPRFLDKIYLTTPSIGIDRVRMELGHMGKRLTRMLEAAPRAWAEGSRTELQRVADMDDEVDRLHGAILESSRDLSREELTAAETRRLEGLFSIANYLESIGDLIETDIISQGIRRLDKRVELHGAAEFGRPLWDAVAASLREVLRALANDDAEVARAVIARKGEIHASADHEMNALGQLLRDGRIDLEGFRISADVVGQIKRLYYNVRKIAQIIRRGASSEADEKSNGKPEDEDA
jgi:phosphate:Na+ symporter